MGIEEVEITKCETNIDVIIQAAAIIEIGEKGVTAEVKNIDIRLSEDDEFRHSLEETKQY